MYPTKHLEESSLDTCYLLAAEQAFHQNLATDTFA